MTHEEMERLFRHGETSPDAISARLIAARKSINMQQKDVGEAIGIAKQTYHSQESRGAPSLATGRYYYRAHGIDFNYLYYGDFLQLDPAVRERLRDALIDAST